MQAETLAEYLQTYGDLLIQKVEESSRPLMETFVRPDVHLLREPMDAQWHRIVAGVKAWQAGRKSVPCSMSMGFGKTLCAIAMIHVHAEGSAYRTIVVCPPHLQKKWVREIEMTIPDAKCKIIDHYSDVLRLVGTNPTGAEWFIMSGNKAKMSTSWKPSFVKSQRIDIGILKCPRCSQPIEKKVVQEGSDVWVFAQEADLAKKQHKCRHCNEALYQWTHDMDRWPVANIIHRQARDVFKYLVIDEAHEAKGERSAIGLSIGKLAATVPFKVALTGTMLNGYADSIFPMSYRLFPGKMKALGFKWNDGMEFTKRYGRIETIVSYKDSESFANRQSRGGGKTTAIKIRPGIVPSIYGDCLLDCAVFGSLEDLGYKLPGLAEVMHPVQMDAEQAEHYEQVESSIRASMRQLIAMGSKAAMSVLLNTLNGWPDHPYGYNSIGYRTAEGEWVEVATPPDLDAETIRTKEAKLVEVVKDAVSRGRQVWIYCEMTQKRDVQVRLKELLDREGLDVRILRSQKVSSCDREEWIFNNGKANVIISNPTLVKTGLDLFDRGGNHNFSVLVFYQTGYNLDTLRQAAARSWRIGQWLDCEVHYMFYEGTMQEQCVRLMSQKTKAAKAIEGNFSQSSFDALTAGDESVAMALAKKLADEVISRVPRVTLAPVQPALPMPMPIPARAVMAKVDRLESKPNVAACSPTILPMAAKCSEVPMVAARHSKSDVDHAGAKPTVAVSPSRMRQWKNHFEHVLAEAQSGSAGAALKIRRLKANLARLDKQEQEEMGRVMDFKKLFQYVEASASEYRNQAVGV
jgi:hypothetical protein